jgi:hypothetical protein
VISTLPFGSAIACEIPLLAPMLTDVPQSSADFRREGPVPETLSDLLLLVDKDSRRRWNKTFQLLVDWKGPANRILLNQLFRRSAMDGFRPFIAGGYLENSIVHHRKGLRYLYKLASLNGVQVQPLCNVAWRKVMVLAEEHHCMVFAERFEAEYEAPSNVTVEEVNEFADDLVRTRQKHKPGAVKAKSKFLRVLRDCGFVENQQIRAARKDDYGEPLEALPEPLQSEVKDMRECSLKSEDDTEWVNDWDNSDLGEETSYQALRQSTADQSVRAICRFYGWVKNICHKEEKIISLDTLFSEKIVRSYQQWLRKVRKHEGGSMRTTFGRMLSMLKSYPKAQCINLTWTAAFLRSLPKTPQKERNARKAGRIVHFHTLEMIPGKIRDDINILIARHNRAEHSEKKRTNRKEGSSSNEKIKKARATRLVRMAALAQSEVIIKYLTTLVWRNQNIRECRINPDLSGPTKEQQEGKKPKPNLWLGPVFPIPGMTIPEWAQERIDSNSSVPLLQFSFDAEETKANRPVMAVLPTTLKDITVEFVNTWRKILVAGVEDPGTLFVNQAGNSMYAEQLEWTVEEATLRYGGQESRSVNPHLFRDIYAAAFLQSEEHYADYFTLSKILWHEGMEVTIRTYSWIFNESVGTNAAGEFSEEREVKLRLREAGLNMEIQKHSADRIPTPPPLGFLQIQRQTGLRLRK